MGKYARKEEASAQRKREDKLDADRPKTNIDQANQDQSEPRSLARGNLKSAGRCRCVLSLAHAFCRTRKWGKTFRAVGDRKMIEIPHGANKNIWRR